MWSVKLGLGALGLLAGLSMMSCAAEIDPPEPREEVGEATASASSDRRSATQGDSSTACGASRCEAGLVCCNESCGICAPPDGFCTQQACAPLEETPPDGGDACGPVTCAEGLVCCNESCGICAPPGGFCTQQACAEA